MTVGERTGQSIGEYVLVLAMAVGAVTAMQLYVGRTIKAHAREVTDEVLAISEAEALVTGTVRGEKTQRLGIAETSAEDIALFGDVFGSVPPSERTATQEADYAKQLLTIGDGVGERHIKSGLYSRSASISTSRVVNKSELPPSFATRAGGFARLNNPAYVTPKKFYTNGSVAVPPTGGDIRRPTRGTPDDSDLGRRDRNKGKEPLPPEDPYGGP